MPPQLPTLAHVGVGVRLLARAHWGSRAGECSPLMPDAQGLRVTDRPPGGESEPEGEGTRRPSHVN
eukprot:scaffold251958_cov38-Tisochrysis_lutea.AAC.2